jgi:large subunit ribosomal protein L21
MLFAVIKTGAKQYKVAEGDVIKIEKLSGDFKKGDKVSFDEVLMIDDGSVTTIGNPTIKGISIPATFEEAGRNKTIDVIKYKAKSNYFKKRGHRQPFVKVKIGKIA